MFPDPGIRFAKGDRPNTKGLGVMANPIAMEVVREFRRLMATSDKGAGSEAPPFRRP